MVRGKGEGSVYRRTSDNRWVAQIEAGRAPSGRRRYARAVRRTRKEAHAALKELVRSADAGLAPGQASTVETYMGWWLDRVAKGTVTATTIVRYDQAIRLWIVPHIGNVRLNKLTPTDVQAMLRRLEERGLSAASRNLARSVLVRALRWAEQTNVIGRNPARIV
jgi:integrase